MAVCILKYLHTEMHSSPLPRMVNVVVILFSTHFLRENLNRKNLAFAEAQDDFLLKKFPEFEHFLFFAGTKECLLRIKANRLKIIRELISEKNVCAGRPFVLAKG